MQDYVHGDMRMCVQFTCRQGLIVFLDVFKMKEFKDIKQTWKQEFLVHLQITLMMLLVWSQMPPVKQTFDISERSKEEIMIFGFY